MIAPKARRSILLGGLIVLAATIVMLPRLASPHFGLLDDGVLPVFAQRIRSEGPGAFFRLQSHWGRFRPVYWLCYVGQYLLWGPNPLAFFVTLYLALIATALLVAGTIVTATKDRRAGLLGGLAVVLSPPVVENYYTLSKVEPVLVLWLALSVFFLFRALDVADGDVARRRRGLAAAVAFLLLAYLSNETAHAMLLVSALWTISAWWRQRHSAGSRRVGVLGWYVAANLACAAIYWGAASLLGTASLTAGKYSAHYTFAPGIVVQSLLRHAAFYVRDFPLLFVLGPAWAVTAMRERDGGSSAVRWRVADCAWWIAGWTAIMLPWHSTLEYRLLPVSVGMSMATGVLLSAIVGTGDRAPRRMGWVRKGALIGGLGLTLVVLINDVTNARIQLTVDASNTALINYLAVHAPPKGAVLVNLPRPNEYVYEMGAHLAGFRGRPDIHVDYFLPGEDVAPGALVVTPVMRHQPFPTVRLAFYESGATAWKAELSARLGRRGTLVYREVEQVPLLYVAIDEPLCPVLIAADIKDGVYCLPERPAIDRRVFHYGWEVYAVGPVAVGSERRENAPGEAGSVAPRLARSATRDSAPN